MREAGGGRKRKREKEEGSEKRAGGASVVSRIERVKRSDERHREVRPRGPCYDLPTNEGRKAATLTGLSKIPETTLQYEGDDDVEATVIFLAMRKYGHASLSNSQCEFRFRKGNMTWQHGSVSSWATYESVAILGNMKVSQSWAT